jgi:tRNA A37 threonylcarbamoyladenosine biosynthesis protein TsaE
MTTFTPHQDSALKAVADWMKAKPGRNGVPPVFRLFGYAGTGKTTLARHIAEGVDGEVKYAAFTGKAALVMRNKGCDNASTIHSLIYRAKESGVEQPSFELWDDAPASKAKLIVIDECSMVDAELGRDLMSFDCPLLVLGDPAQLPPIQGGGFFTDCEPDSMLTEVHRQAQDDPIVRMSMDIREGRELEIGRHGESEVVPRSELDPPQQHPPRLQHARAPEAEHRGSLSGGRRQAGLPAQQPEEGPVQRRVVARQITHAAPGEIEDPDHAAVARRGVRPQGYKGFGAPRLLRGRHRRDPVGTAQTV